MVDRDAMLAFASQYDPQYFHADPEAAKRSTFGDVVASGIYTMALWRWLDHDIAHDIAWICGVAWDDVRFPKALRAGDTIHARAKCLSKRDSPQRAEAGIVVYEYTLLNQRDDRSLVAARTWSRGGPRRSRQPAEECVDRCHAFRLIEQRRVASPSDVDRDEIRLRAACAQTSLRTARLTTRRGTQHRVSSAAKAGQRLGTCVDRRGATPRRSSGRCRAAVRRRLRRSDARANATVLTQVRNAAPYVAFDCATASFQLRDRRRASNVRRRRKAATDGVDLGPDVVQYDACDDGRAQRTDK
jgi:acyl dehydratase